MIELILWALLAGIIIGPWARLVLPGEQNISIVMTILLGAVGALVGGIVYRALGGTDTPGIDWLLLVVEVVVVVGGAAVVVSGTVVVVDSGVVVVAGTATEPEHATTRNRGSHRRSMRRRYRRSPETRVG